MSRDKKEFDLIKTIRKIARDEQLDSGIKQRSKSWGGKPSSKEERRKTKSDLQKMVELQDFSEEDEESYE